MKKAKQKSSLPFLLHTYPLLTPSQKWLSRGDLVCSRVGFATIIHDAETHISLQGMGMQNGTYHWAILYSTVDSEIVVRVGSFKTQGRFREDNAQLVDELNAALTEMLKHWNKKFLPVAEGFSDE